MKHNKKERLIPDILNEMDSVSNGFWSIPSGSFSELTAYYSENLERCISGANSIADNHTKEAALFWSELIRTDFIIKFGIESQFNLNFKKKVDDLKEAVSIIKNTFENSYEYFAYYTISDKLETDKLYNLWYKPFKAKELATEKEDSFWTIDGKKVSGKYWVLNNCELLKFSDLDIKLMKSIRDAESHENLVYTLEGIAILEGKKTKELRKEEVIRFAEFLKECIGLVFHFALTFLIKEKFWIFLSSFIATENKYRNSDAPFHLLGKISEKRKEKLDLANLIKPGFCAIIALFIKYALHEIWNDIEAESTRLNNRLKNIGFKFKTDEIENLRLSAQCD
ncbi:MAG TPA: hypothetical protein PJ990_16405, partial [Saprospiraceae bacterium]|nr:hypothetical protein [Saprospiraceae bacterium]